MVNSANLGEIFRFGAIPGKVVNITPIKYADTKRQVEDNLLFHILSSGISEHLSGTGGVGNATGLGHHLASGSCGILSVIEEALQTAAHHLLKSDNHDTISAAVGDGAAGHG